MTVALHAVRTFPEEVGMSTNNTSSAELTDREKELRERIDALIREARKDKGALSIREAADYFDDLNITDREFDHAVDFFPGRDRDPSSG